MFPSVHLTLRSLFMVFGCLVLQSISSMGQDDQLDPNRQRIRAVIATADVSGGGIFYYVIFRPQTEENLVDENWIPEKNVVVRGQMSYEGISRVILAPETDYRIYAIYADSLMFSSVAFSTPEAGERFTIPKLGYHDLVLPDDDGDGLDIIRELIVGTDETMADTDGDGVNDGAEVQQGTDPLSGLLAATGVISTATMPGRAFDVVTSNNIAVVAGLEAGVSIFNIEASRSPTRIAQIDTPGNAYQVSLFGEYVAVADSDAGLTVIDIADPPAAKVLHSVNFGQSATMVTNLGTITFVGCSNGLIVSADMVSGSEISRYQGLSGRIWSLALRGDYLYALRTGELSIFRIENGEFDFIRTVTATGNVGAGQRPLRIFIARDQLYTTFQNGFNVFSLADPTNPILQARHTTAQQGWKQIALNGNGLVVATVSPNSTNDGVHHVSLYSIGEDGLDLEFSTEFETPGLASSVALYNGKAYIADTAEGLQVINYLAFDRFGIAPEITLDTNAVDGMFEEGKFMNVRALATDDVQIRNVQLYINDDIVSTDGNYPFDFQISTPLISSGVSSFQIHAVATDTGGNMTTSSALEVILVPDNTQPRVMSILPKNGAYVGSANAIVALVNEPIDTATLTPKTFSVSEAGADKLFGTEDDQLMTGALSFDETTNRISWDYSADLPVGIYLVSITAPLSDIAGNELRDSFASSFKLLGYVDSDGDGLPDFWEIEKGFDPFNPDSNGDGIPDGKEDGDEDNLPNIGEFLLNTDPTKKDTNGDGTNDGDYDEDFDGLLAGDEFLMGTDPSSADTDGDGISDFDEINVGTNPLISDTLPPVPLASQPASFLNAVPPASEDNAIIVFSPEASYEALEP